MRILMTTRGSTGHLLPLAPFGHACRAAGHAVLVSAQRQHEDNVRRTGLPYAPVDDPAPERWMPLIEEFGRMDVDAANARMIGDYFAGLDTDATLPGLRSIVEAYRPDVIVRETWEYASTLVGELLGIPVVRVALGLGTVEDRSIGLAAPAVDAARATLGLPADPTGARLRATPYFTMVPEALEAPGAAPAPLIYRFGSGAATTPTEPLGDWWPGNDDPLVYVTLGSVAPAAHMPYFPVLYRTIIDALAGLPVRLLVTIGRGREPHELGPVPANVRVERWVPQDTVAREAAVIVGHGGYGTTLGAVAHGVPLVVLPLCSIDQWANAAAVARSGVGVQLAGDRDTRAVLALPGERPLSGLRDAVRHVVTEPAYRDRARRMAAAMRALPSVDAAVPALEGICESARRSAAA